MGALCQDHWDRLREAINKRGLTPLVAEGGEAAATKMKRQMEEGVTIDTFEPLILAANTILANAMETISEIGGNPLYLLIEGPEDPLVEYDLEAKTWPRCPLCYLGLAHEATCKDKRCILPIKDGYAFWIDKAADGVLKTWQELKL